MQLISKKQFIDTNLNFILHLHYDDLFKASDLDSLSSNLLLLNSELLKLKNENYKDIKIDSKLNSIKVARELTTEEKFHVDVYLFFAKIIFIKEQIIRTQKEINNLNKRNIELEEDLKFYLKDSNNQDSSILDKIDKLRQDVKRIESSRPNTLLKSFLYNLEYGTKLEDLKKYIKELEKKIKTNNIEQTTTQCISIKSKIVLNHNKMLDQNRHLNELNNQLKSIKEIKNENIIKDVIELRDIFSNIQEKVDSCKEFIKEHPQNLELKLLLDNYENR